MALGTDSMVTTLLLVSLAHSRVSCLAISPDKKSATYHTPSFVLNKLPAWTLPALVSVRIALLLRCALRTF